MGKYVPKTKKLMHCPFCKDLQNGVWLDDGFYSVVCYCGIAGPSAETIEQAQEAWNTRQSDTELVDALQDLYDEQNGPPLIRHQSSWQKAMDKAGEMLTKFAPELCLKRKGGK